MIKKEIWGWVIKEYNLSDFKIESRIKKFLEKHMLEIEKLYHSEKEKLWIKSVKSKGIVEKIQEYLSIFLGLFQNTPFSSINRVIITPAFLNHPAIYRSSLLNLEEIKSLKRFILSSYNYIDIKNICPALYTEVSKVVILPLYESGSSASNELIFSFFIAHEFAHAITLWLYGSTTRWAPEGIEMTEGSFSHAEIEIITNIIAIRVLSKSISIPKEIVHYIDSLDWKSISEIMGKIMRVEGRDFLRQNQVKSLKNLSIKRLRGILEKHLGYKKQVKGLTREQLINIISKRLSTKWMTEKEGKCAELKIKLKETMRLKETAKVIHKFILFISDLDEERHFREYLPIDE